MTETKQKSEFVVLKKSFTFQTCAKCDGTGRKSTPLRKLTFVKDCPECFGSGRKMFTTTEEVPLADALHEIASKTELKRIIINQ